MRTRTSRALVATASAAVLVSAVLGGAEASAAPVKGTSAALGSLVRNTGAPGINGSDWDVQAFFDGDDTHLASQSPMRSFVQLSG